MINASGEYWSEKIVSYCGDKHITLTDFARMTDIHINTIRKIVGGTTKVVSPKTLGILWNTIVRNA